MIRKKDLLKDLLKRIELIEKNEIISTDPQITKSEQILNNMQMICNIRKEIYDIKKTVENLYDKEKQVNKSDIMPIKTPNYIIPSCGIKEGDRFEDGMKAIVERNDLISKWTTFNYKKKLKNTKLKAEFEQENKIVLEKLKEFEIEKITFDELQDLEISFKRQIYKQELINKYKEK